VAALGAAALALLQVLLLVVAVVVMHQQQQQQEAQEQLQGALGGMAGAAPVQAHKVQQQQQVVVLAAVVMVELEVQGLAVLLLLLLVWLAWLSREVAAEWRCEPKLFLVLPSTTRHGGFCTAARAAAVCTLAVRACVNMCQLAQSNSSVHCALHSMLRSRRAEQQLWCVSCAPAGW
jgi:hypothetical protein